MACGASPDDFWEMDTYEALVFIRGYQSRMDDAMERDSLFTTALINSTRTKKDKKIKPSDLFDRKALEKKKAEAREGPEAALQKQLRAQERATRLPVPARLRRGAKSRPVPPPS